MKIKICFLILFLILLVENVIAVPPFEAQVSTATVGLDVRIPQSIVIKQNQDVTANVHVWNKSNGMPIDNTSTSCYIHLYDKIGTPTAAEEMNFDSEYVFDWVLSIDGNNFSEIGSHSAIIQCNNTNEGGFASIGFEVTKTGIDPTTALSLIYIVSILISIILLFISLFLAWSIDGENKFEMGEILEVNLNKYIKILLAFLSYLFLILTTFFAWKISDNFLTLGFVSSMFNIIFTALWYLFIPFFFGFLTIIIIKAIADIGLHNLKVRGLKTR